MNRRRFIAAIGVSSLAGCTELTGSDDSNDVQDSDEDGVIDSEDYAPNDPDVQEKENLQSTPTATPTDSPTPTDTPRDVQDLNIETPTIEDTAEPVTFDDVVAVPGPGYYQLQFEFDQQFVLNWRVTNQRSSDYDFDVWVMSEDEYQVYIDYVNDESSHRPQVYNDGSAQGITDEATRTATLDPGTYQIGRAHV